MKPTLNDFVDNETIDTLIRLAIAEDLGPANMDITSFATIDADAQGQAVMASHATSQGRLCGGAILEQIAAAYDPDIKVTLNAQDGDAIEPKQIVATFEGPIRALLAMERVALNFACHLSGIATLTHQFVDEVRDTRASIYDTRKTLPGYRGLAKYAVVCGGGKTHRIGLYDALLVKDNHLAHTPMDQLAAAIENVRASQPELKFVQVEVDTLEQFERVLTMNVDIVLLDNMTPQQLRDAVRMRNRMALHVELEASGGVRLDTVRAIAESGVDRISIGALTHSPPAFDLGLDIA